MLTVQNDLERYLAQKGFWFDKGQHPGFTSYTLNCIDPEEEVDMQGEEDGSIFELNIEDSGKLNARWIYDSEGYNEAWKFNTVKEFELFYEKFLSEGIDGV